MYHNFIPVGANLCKQGIVTSMQCCFCMIPDEKPVHVFLDCWWSKTFWNYLQLDHIIYKWRCEDLGDWLWKNVSSLNMEKLAMLLCGLYRNTLAHGNKCLDVVVTTLNTKVKVTKILNCNLKFLIIGEDASFSWEGSDDYAIKLNCDASWFPSTKKAGFGCVAPFQNE